MIIKVYQSPKFEILKPLGPFKYHLRLSKSIMIINLLLIREPLKPFSWTDQ